jgi:protease I
MKKALLIIAHEGYQQVEYNTPKELLMSAGIIVETASNKPGTAVAKDGSKTSIDMVLTDVAVGQYDAIVFIGGPGAMDNLDNEDSYAIVRHAVEDGIPLAAICIAPRILAKAHILTNKRATGWDGDGQMSDMFFIYGVEYVKEDVVVDGLIVTATGPHAAQEFGRQILTLINQ